MNDAPVAANLSANVLEGGIVDINLAAAATDVEGAINANSIVIVHQPLHGDLTVNADGTVFFAHDDSEPSPVSFTYTIKDAQGLTSNIATVTLNVQAVNDAPVVTDEVRSINSNLATALTFNVLANDTDPDGPNPLTVTSVIGGSVGTSFAGTYGTITIDANGSFSFLLDPDAVDELLAGTPGIAELIAYEVSDGLTSSFGVVEIDITIL